MKIAKRFFTAKREVNTCQESNTDRNIQEEYMGSIYIYVMENEIIRDSRGRVMPGGKLALKYDTSEAQMELIERFCGHLEEGYTQESFEEADPRTVHAYAERLTAEMQKSEEFTILPTVLIQRALRTAQKKWEHWGIQGMINKIPYFNAQIWAINMRNRFNWDKEDKTPKEIVIDRIVTVNFTRDENKGE